MPAWFTAAIAAVTVLNEQAAFAEPPAVPLPVAVWSSPLTGSTMNTALLTGSHTWQSLPPQTSLPVVQSAFVRQSPVVHEPAMHRCPLPYADAHFESSVGSTQSAHVEVCPSQGPFFPSLAAT